MVSNSYFKVTLAQKFVFFDRRSKKSTQEAWDEALATATSHVASVSGLTTGDTMNPEDLVSVWEKPIENGVWDTAVLIGERRRGALLSVED